MPQPMAKYSLPSGAIFEAPSGLSEEDLAQFAMENFPDEFQDIQQPSLPQREAPRRGQEEPSLFGRFTGSFAEGLSRGMGSVLPGIGAGFSDLVGDEEGFQRSLGSIRENSANAAEFNPLPSSFAEVRQKYRGNGVGSAMLEMADLAAQGTGGSLAYVAPSLAVVGLGTLGVLSAPAAVLALGGTAVLSTVQYFSEQLDRAAEEAERKGEQLDSEDVNLAKQLAFAMGQTGLERASLLTTGLFKGVLKNEAVRNAANSAAANTMLKFADDVVPDSKAARAVLSGLSEVVTETGQTAFERAAAGLSVAPDGEDPEEWQRAFDEYVETWVSAMLVGTGMGAAVGHLETRGEKHRPGIEEDVVFHDDTILPEDMDKAEIQSVMGLKDEVVLSKEEIEARAQAEAMDKRRRQEEINVISSIRKADSTVADRIESRLGFIGRKAKSENKKFRSEAVSVANDIRKRERTVNDIYNLLDHRGADYESSEDAVNTLRSFIRRTAGVSSIEKATPAQLDRVYKAIESNRTGSNLAMPDVDIAANVLRAMSTKAKLSSAEVSRVASGLPAPKAAKVVGPEIASAAEAVAEPAPEFDKRTAGIISRLVQRGVVKKAKSPKTGKYSYSVPGNISAVLKDPDFDAKSDLIIELMNQREGREAVRYPSFDELIGRKQTWFAEEVPDLVTREEYDAIKQIHSALGVDSSIQDTKRSAPPMRTEYERGSEPAWRWVVRDEDGNVRRVESSRKQAENFVAGNKDSGLKAPARERGYVVRENSYTGDGKMSRLVKSVPAHFVSASESDAKSKADAWVKERVGESELLLDEPHFLGTQTRGDKGSTGRVARLQRLAKSGDASDFKRAVKIVKTGRNPLSAGRVLKSYGFGVTEASPAAEDVHTQGEVDLKIPVSITGKIVKKSYPVTVKAGVLMPDGKGFGVAKISSHYEDWASTRYGSWRSALDKIVTDMGNEQAIQSGRMTVFPDGYGRVVAILQDPKGYVDRKPIEIDVEAEIQQLYMDAPRIERAADQRGDYRLDRDIDPAYHATLKKKVAEIRENARFAKENPDIVASRLAEKAEPITAIFDMVTDSRGNPSYHVVNMFVGKKNMDIEMWGPDQAKGHEPFYGRNASPRSIAIINGQSNPMRNPAGSSPATDITFNSPILRSAAKLKPATEQKPNSIWKYINDAVTEWTGKPDFLLRLRRGWIDSYAPLQNAEGRLVSDGHKEFMVNVGTMGMARNVSNAANMANSALFEGFLKWTPTGTVVDADQRAMQSIEGVFTTENFELNDQSEPILVLDPVARQMVRRVFKVDGMHSEKLKNKMGGFATIFSSTVSEGKNLSGQMFQYAMGVRAWNMLNVEGKDKSLVPKVVQDNMADWLDLPNRHPEIGVAYSNLQRLNRHTVELSVQSGILSRTDADALLKNSDYTPFMVEQTGDKEIFDKLLGGVNQINPDIPYKGWFELGSDQKMADPMQAFLGNFTRHVAAAVNNITRSRAIRDQVALGLARRWSEKKGTGSKITVFENGESVAYEVDDRLAFETIHGEIGKDWGQVFRTDPVLKWVTTKPSEWLRESVSRSPDFALTNVIRDSLQVMMINGLGVKSVGDIWKRALVNMGKAFSDNEMSKSFRHLKRNGIITGWGHVGFQGSVKDVVADINADLASKSEGRGRNAAQRAWDMLGRWSAASESASREIVFEDSYNYHRNELRADPEFSDNEAEAVAIAQALYDAREVLNFTRRGNNQFLKILLQLAPFTGARIQGLDIVGRAIFGYAPVGYKRMSPDQVRRSIAQRAGIIASASAALAMLNYGDDDYENEDGYVRDMNWLFPIPGTNTHFALPIPFELGLISKVVPEQITRASISALEGEFDKGQRDAARAARHAFVNTLGLSGFVPVVARPVVEAFSNKSIFTGRPIVPYYEQFKPTEEQFGVHTSIQARGMSSMGLSKLGISPRLIDNEVRTIGGGLGVYAWSVMDHVARLVLPGVPNLPVPRMADTVGFKRFVKDEFSSGVQSELYEFQRELDQSFSRLKDASKAERPELTRKLQPDMAVRPAIHALTKRLKGQKDRIEAIMESDMSIIKKRSMIDEVERSNHEIYKLYRDIRSRHDKASSG